MTSNSQPPVWVGILMVVAAVAVTYHSAPSFPFVWTDHAEIEEKTLVPLSAKEVVGFFTLPKGEAKAPARQLYQAKATSDRYAYFRPVKALTYGLDWLTGGGRPWSFHLTNLLLHAGVCVLMLFLGRRWWGSRHPYLAEALACLHAVFPLHVEAVAWISARSDILWGLFLLGALLMLLRSREVARKWLHRLGISLLMLGAVGSKESGIVSVGIVMFFSLLLPDRRQPLWWRRLAGECAGPVAAMVFYLLYRQLLVADVQLDTLVSRPPLGTWTLLHLFGLNLAQSFLPMGLTVADTLEVLDRPSLLGILGPLLWITWAYVGFRLRPSNPLLLLGALSWLLAIAPVSQCIPLLHPRAERYLYVPSLFAEMCLVWTLWSLFNRLRREQLRRFVIVGAIATWMCLMLLSHTRLKSWSDERRLFSEAVVEQPNCAECWNNLAYIVAVDGRYLQAQMACLRALSIDRERYRGARDGFSLRWILSQSLLLQGKGHQAIPWLMEIISKLGTTHASLGMLTQALTQSLASNQLPIQALLWLPAHLPIRDNS